jgi:hypothetical protein
MVGGGGLVFCQRVFSYTMHILSGFFLNAKALHIQSCLSFLDFLVTVAVFMKKDFHLVFTTNTSFFVCFRSTDGEPIGFRTVTESLPVSCSVTDRNFIQNVADRSGRVADPDPTFHFIADPDPQYSL